MTEVPHDLPLDEPVEIEPGVVVERRDLLKTAAVALGMVSLPGVPSPRVGSTAATSLTIEEFIAEAGPAARALVDDTSLVGQRRYLHLLASYAVRLVDVPVPELRESSQGQRVSVGSNGAPGPFVILHWRMEPGAVIRAHAHTYGHVVTLGLAGEARVENHEVLGPKRFDSDEPFRVRRTCTRRLVPGSTNLVDLERDCVHGFVAGPDGARGLDITTRIREPQDTPYLELGDEVSDEPGVFSARWGR